MTLIFDIKRYAINDGPGIRTTIFLKGCPLRCVWCHNPEGWSMQPQIVYKRSKCIGCGSCVEACGQQALSMGTEGIAQPTDDCILCGACTETCPTLALEMCGREWDWDELMAEVEKERDVMEDSGGGVTICGGEPLMHHTYTLHLLHLLGERHFHRTIDTSVYAPTQIVADIADACELMLVDLKMMDSARHLQFTGVDNDIILNNINWLAEHEYHFSIRIPLIDGINTDEENITQTALFLHSLPNSERRTIHLLPYHDMGIDKHRRMWSVYNPENLYMATPSDLTLRQCTDILSHEDWDVVVGG